MATISGFNTIGESGQKFFIGDGPTYVFDHGEGNTFDASSATGNVSIFSFGGSGSGVPTSTAVPGATMYAGTAKSVLSGGGGDDSLFGNADSDSVTTLSGNAGDDTLTAGKGTTLMSGGAGEDTFVFNGGGGTHTVTDYEDGDTVSLAENINGTGLTSANLDTWIADHATQVGANVLVDLGGGDTLQINNATVADINFDVHS